MRMWTLWGRCMVVFPFLTLDGIIQCVANCASCYNCPVHVSVNLSVPTNATRSAAVSIPYTRWSFRNWLWLQLHWSCASLGLAKAICGCPIMSMYGVKECVKMYIPAEKARHSVRRISCGENPFVWWKFTPVWLLSQYKSTALTFQPGLVYKGPCIAWPRLITHTCSDITFRRICESQIHRFENGAAPPARLHYHMILYTGLRHSSCCANS